MAQPQFNFLPLRSDSPEAQDVSALAGWLSLRFQKLAAVLKGPTSSAFTVTGAKAITLSDVDQTTVTLTGDSTLTLDTKSSRRGAWADLELVQDATGAHAVTFVNALWASSTAPTVAAGSGKRTLIRFVNVNGAWVGAVHASNY